MSASPRSWAPPRRIARAWLRRALLCAALAYLIWALASLDIDLERLHKGVARGARVLSGFLAPSFGQRGADIWEGLRESAAMTLVATAVGAVLCVPLALGAARTLAPLPIYLFCRAVLVLLRGFHEVVIALLFVALVGFGPFAGVLTLVVASCGFLAKLLSEALEQIDQAPIEALRASGASWPQTLVFAVAPQVAPRFAGLALYRLDINFRESALLGVVGAGGLGATLNTAFDRYEYGTAAAILLLIIAIVFGGEQLSARLRKRLT